MARTVLEMNEQGRITLPVDVRKALHLGERAQFQYELTDAGVLLKPVVAVPLEDRWAYQPETLQSIRRALDDVRAGRVMSLAPSDLLGAASHAGGGVGDARTAQTGTGAEETASTRSGTGAGEDVSANRRRGQHGRRAQLHSDQGSGRGAPGSPPDHARSADSLLTKR